MQVHCSEFHHSHSVFSTGPVIKTEVRSYDFRRPKDKAFGRKVIVSIIVFR